MNQKIIPQFSCFYCGFIGNNQKTIETHNCEYKGKRKPRIVSLQTGKIK